MKQECILSVILPVYNVEKYLRQCLDSIFSQIDCELNEKIEVIAIDDGSPDHSGGILDDYSIKYSSLKVIHKENAGVAAARNTGIKTSQGKWLYFMDSDDWLAGDALKHVIQNIGSHYDCDVILMDAYKSFDTKNVLWEHFSKEKMFDTPDVIKKLQCGTLYYPIIKSDKKAPIAAPWDKVYRKSFLCEHGIFFQETLKVLDDMVFNMEVFGVAKKVCYCKNRIYHYRYVADSITNQYKSDRVDKDCQVWEYINVYQKERNQDALFEQAFYCRIIKSFAICCRLTFFNEKNENTFQNRKREVLRVLLMDPYQEAFSQVKLGYLEWKLKAVVLCCRLGWINGLYLLHKAEMLIRPRG